MLDWSQCSGVERVPGRVSGAWVICGTRVPAQAVIDNAKDGFTAERIAAGIHYGLPVEPTCRVIEFAKRAHAPRPARLECATRLMLKA